jgi:membrane protease YdiL (CAAX protease family)
MAGLSVLVAVRFAATRAGLDPMAVGAGFGLGLVALVVARPGRLRLGPCPLTAALLGGGVGIALVALVVAGAGIVGGSLVPGLGRPAAPFLPWATVTLAVAVSEEAILRGILFDRVRRAGGPIVALLATTALFALMHVPLYGWHVVPLDLAVGLALGGLRIATRGVVAPAAAHAVADLATWWL